MGWISYKATFYKKGRIDKIEEIKSLYNNEENFKLLKASAVGNTIYTAVEHTKDNEKKVFGVVYLTSTNMKEDYNFAYKEVEESLGPCEIDCPASILKLLTPIDSEYANEWRNKCWENIREKQEKKKNPNSLKNLPIGAVIEMNPWKEDGNTLKLEKIDYPRYKSPIWYCRETGFKYQPKDIESVGYKVIAK